ncbi:Ubiquitin-activating enzyme E1 [Spraguea lophii 42_110]|uniref:Ubiquitin-activating enzyme E1 n=1 Tax=Spraguea lophii (strain 42_110) TaxID=1358809 RepID=S7W4S7_SPRLO|nr:Ubiquitin-activating enzyme E1 [Spraguea lophii 42_110]
MHKTMKIDESLYSRQLYVLGREAMEKMMESNILIIGMDGLGQEIAKNIALAGVNFLTLFDKSLVCMDDLATGFYFDEKSIGSRRDLCVEKNIKELNPYVRVNVLEELDDIKNYSLVILCNEDYNEQIKYNNICRENGVYFIGCQTRGFFSQVFCDFLEKFIILDPNGEEPSKGHIKNISKNGIVKLIDRHQLENGDIIEITSTEIKEYDSQKFRVKIINPIEIQLIAIKKDLSENNSFKFIEMVGGNYEQKILPQTIDFKKLEDIINNPCIIQSTENIETEKIIHNCFKLIAKYNKEKKPIEKKQYKEFIEFYKEEIGAIDENEIKEKEEIIRNFVLQYNYQIIPMVSVIGGFVAQEALKACSSKFTPLHQFLYFFSNIKVTEEIVDGNNDRYSQMYNLLGKNATEKILNSSVFVVGSGAIGCEHLKNLAMLGIGIKGKIFLTDMDSIEQSNLNRQFLFRREDVGKMKSEVAAREIMKINDKVTVEYFTQRVATETENIFSDKFFSQIDLVANALDNVNSRIYMDRRCIENRTPLFDSGTLGTKGNTQVIIPFLTESYSSSRDPPEKSIPLCTLRNFPHLIDHTIEWALSEFNAQFNKTILSIKEYLSKNEDNVDVLSDEIGSDIQEVIKKAPFTKNECIKAGVALFVKLFHTSIRNLISTFPPDHLTEEGTPFWEAPRVAPSPISFEYTDDLHLTFVESAANLYAQSFNVRDMNTSTDSLCTAVENIKTEDNIIVTINKDDVVKYLNEEVYFDNYETIDFDDLENSKKKLKPITVPEDQKIIDPDLLTIIEFEKDDDTNFHVNFIYAAANLRAMNYKIKTTDRLTVKGIAGRIVPAIATTTALVSGLATLEILKYIIEQKEYRNTFVNLALPFIGTSEPIEPLKNKINLENIFKESENYETKYKNIDTTNFTKEIEYTLWDRIELEDTSINKFIEYFLNKYNLETTMISTQGKVLYCSFYNKDKYKNNLTKSFKELIENTEDKMFIYVDVLFEPYVEEFIPIVIKL